MMLTAHFCVVSQRNERESRPPLPSHARAMTILVRRTSQCICSLSFALISYLFMFSIGLFDHSAQVERRKCIQWRCESNRTKLGCNYFFSAKHSCLRVDAQPAPNATVDSKRRAPFAASTVFGAYPHRQRKKFEFPCIDTRVIRRVDRSE